ncbi:radical SAM protein [Verrucomicrobia bacterium LW23]|nr:radical SAM protein [Verrucomicrobia bacterium LW23]
MRLNLLYRGPLSSCDYACDYCPFAKTRNSAAELADDAAKLRRFVAWAGGLADDAGATRLGVLFTPWGEALIRAHYREALVVLSHMQHVARVAVQTNLSCRLDWARRADPQRLAFWATYHPSQVALDDFVAQCARLDGMGLRYSVGIVGLKENLDAMEELRRRLPEGTYVWVNAYKRVRGYYAGDEVARIEAVDPHFGMNNRYHASLGEECMAGESAFSVDGEGDMYRCHFIREKIGNIYEAGWREGLRPRRCSNAVCGCHIGYVHMPRTGAAALFGEGVLERIPAAFSSAR